VSDNLEKRFETYIYIYIYILKEDRLVVLNIWLVVLYYVGV